ncbi:hypothetical protein V2J09_019360 [Rumex salicifolius]
MVTQARLDELLIMTILAPVLASFSTVAKLENFNCSKITVIQTVESNQAIKTYRLKQRQDKWWEILRCRAISVLAKSLLPLNRQRTMPSKLPFSPNRFLYRLLSLRHQTLSRNGESINPNFTTTRQFCSTIPGSDPKPNSSGSIDAGCSIRKPVASLWPGMYHSPVTNALWEARSNFFESKTGNDLSNGGDDGNIVLKTPGRSRTSIDYKFSNDYVLKEQYRNPWNEIRMGKLVEDLDALAGTVSYKHCSGHMKKPPMLVTASVDRIVLKKPIRVDADLSIVGAVTWVGRSSMEIQMEYFYSAFIDNYYSIPSSVSEALQGEDPVALVANFTFVARDSETGQATPINKISPETEREQQLWEEAEARNNMRRIKRTQQKSQIENGDSDRIKNLLAEGRIFVDMPALADRDSILIRNTLLQSSIICQPQQRNIHGRIFGGFLMRKAFELAFATAYTFGGREPRFVEVDHVDFVKPVDVGNFLRMKSCVLYTELENPVQPMINIEVVAHVTCPELRSSEVSNKFYFTFTIRPEAMTDGLKIRNVLPETEEEARRVIERMDTEHSKS